MASKRKRAYWKYLESAHWRELRRQAFERDGFKCCQCGSDRDLRGHHRRYRKDLTKCTVKDIETLCVKCHEAHHRDRARERRQNRKLRKQLCRAAYLVAIYSAKP